MRPPNVRLFFDMSFLFYSYQSPEEGGKAHLTISALISLLGVIEFQDLETEAGGTF